MTKPGSSKLKCPFCEGHIEVPNEMLGQWTTCPHCQKEIPLETPIDLPSGFKAKAANLNPTNTKQPTIAKKRKLNRWLIAAAVIVPLCVLAVVGVAFGELPGGGAIRSVGMFGTGALGVVVSLIVLVLAVFWAICLILMPIYVYYIHRILQKIEQNTRPNQASVPPFKT